MNRKGFKCPNVENKVLCVTIVKLKFNHLHKVLNIHSFAETCSIVSRHLNYLYKNKGTVYGRLG